MAGAPPGTKTRTRFGACWNLKAARWAWWRPSGCCPKPRACRMTARPRSSPPRKPSGRCAWSWLSSNQPKRNATSKSGNGTDMESVIDTLAQLVSINSVNPAYAGGRPETAIADFITGFFGRRGIEVWQQEALPGRPNVIARLPGCDPSRRVIFEAHTDTASVMGMSIPPFEPAIRKGRLYGRGSCDTKAGLAAMMHAAAELAACGETPPCEIWVVGAADEEHNYRGVVRLCQGLTASAAIVSEPTDLRLVTATKG